MKLNKITFVAVIALTALATACISNKVTEWRDSKIYQGEGGAVETINEVEVWLKGTPDRKFKVIAFIEHAHGTGGLVGVINSASWKSGVAKKAKNLGGDAVIIETRYRELTGYSGN